MNHEDAGDRIEYENEAHDEFAIIPVVLVAFATLLVLVFAGMAQ